MMKVCFICFFSPCYFYRQAKVQILKSTSCSCSCQDLVGKLHHKLVIISAITVFQLTEEVTLWTASHSRPAFAPLIVKMRADNLVLELKNPLSRKVNMPSLQHYIVLLTSIPVWKLWLFSAMLLTQSMLAIQTFGHSLLSYVLCTQDEVPNVCHCLLDTAPRQYFPLVFLSHLKVLH